MTMQTILRPLSGQSVSFDGTSGGAKNSTSFKNSNISVEVTSAAYLKFGGSSVTVSSSDYDIRLSSGIRYDLSTGGATHCAIIQDSSSGTAYINEWTHKAL